LHTEATVSAPAATASATWRSPTTAQWQKITVSLHVAGSGTGHKWGNR
jgi:hypothetical protein